LQQKLVLRAKLELEKEKNKFPCWDFAHGMERSSLGGSSSGELCQQT